MKVNVFHLSHIFQKKKKTAQNPFLKKKMVQMVFYWGKMENIQIFEKLTWQHWINYRVFQKSRK